MEEQCVCAFQIEYKLLGFSSRFLKRLLLDGKRRYFFQNKSMSNYFFAVFVKISAENMQTDDLSSLKAAVWNMF